MLLMVELREVRLVLRVRFQNARRFQALDAVLVDIRNLILEEQRIDALVLIIRTNGYQEEIERIHFLGFQRTEDIVPTEGEQSAAAFAQCFGDIRHSQTYTHYLIFLIHHHRHEIEIENGEIHRHVILLLFVGHRLEVV